ncbi:MULTISPECIES: monofunctional biosynthetic peptidoglycan transglycosylase [unclassified Mucilaginibacter]|uniref:monofunctional biosynthetic peptidoglycan transglycosylase n=1 Tax=unclassified Mucilaginibacter TaxID=2617802 RepID=UPI002AC8E15B|nr:MULTISPECIES: monofunctional biosynthetic peptidoglycan transglycosylase [unclassified Mucilaginibacter]MEB0260525.1 monofunctional biosynthetic peptidoglycan transglycosylase [Mucilaginibacter sp. 10I4]MEB0278119.1 monofunctional biosynthetic peptidoglycan transglycosylase [Mucilaginibacter sp. 10B2]MEB0301777.1 monofunctional biosynthetic peptidoglycan transglycosylase [Mucilaginibacter sp. 5C4]WPX23031.1 monofunctional biosynthetic peptidoglycan transglycosylase [Mucilaginibacter sp. 5C4]
MAKKAQNRKSSSKTKGFFNNGVVRLVLRVVKLVIIVFVAASLFGVLLFKFVNPPFTWLMIQRGFERKADGKDWKIDKQWVAFDDIADNMKRAAVAAEDQSFLENHGFDFKAIERAIQKNAKSKKLIGGSTISQQTAKNVFLYPGRSFVRKGFEAWFTILIEAFWTKKRIMEVYLNVIEMGDGIYGIGAASQAYFHKPALQLTRRQSAAIAVIFPSPLRWSATNPTRYLRHRQYLIMKNMQRLGPLEF